MALILFKILIYFQTTFRDFLSFLIQQQSLGFLLQYGESLICALAIAWGRKGRTGNRQFDVIPNRDLLTDQQGQLLDLICSVRSLRCDVTLNLVKSVINQPPELPSVITSKKRKITYEVSLFQII